MAGDGVGSESEKTETEPRAFPSIAFWGLARATIGGVMLRPTAIVADYWELREALRRRAARNFRTLRAEIRAILTEALADEIAQIRAERERDERQGGVGDALQGETSSR